MARPSTPSGALHAYTRTWRRDDGVLVTEMIGVATGAVIETMHQQVLPSLGKDDICWVVDTTAVPSFTPDLAGPAARLLADFRQRGPLPLIAVITSSVIRMMGQSLCFAAGVKLISVETTEEAEREIAKLRAPR